MRIRRFLLCAALAVGACSHEQPFETTDVSSDTPFRPGLPTQLTYNPGSDLHAAWADDGRSFLYSAQLFGRPDFDRCLFQLPATGGSSLVTICNPNPAAADSADLFDMPALYGTDRLLFVRTIGRPGAVAPNTGGVYLGTLHDPLAATRLFPLPYAIPGGRTHGMISTPLWVSQNRAVYVGQSVIYSRETNGAPLDTLVTGLEVVELALGGTQPAFAVVASTYGASSAALSTTRDTLYYTVINDSRVFRLSLISGQTTVAHDFGVLGIARDVTVLGARLVAVVGGEVEYHDDPVLGPIQPDGGGPLYSVDLATGTELLLPTDTLLFFRRPAFAPTGSPVRLVAEGYPRRVNLTRNALVSKVGDLYLYEAP